MLIVVCSDKGSPGATTTALALGASWPERVAVVEADPRGGDLASWLLPGAVSPSADTVLELGAAARRDAHSTGLVLDHATGLTERLGLVPGIRIAEQAAELEKMWQPLADAMWCSDVDVIADVGHLHADSPAIPVAAAADKVIVVGRPTIPSIGRLPERLANLTTTLDVRRDRHPVLVPVIIGPRRRADLDTSRLLAMLAGSHAKPTWIGHLPFDTPAVSRLVDGHLESERLARTPLMRSCAVLASRLHPTAARWSPEEPEPTWPPTRTLKVQ